ncbi:hypothetical protein ACA910_007349 [Epithemia clementina (nom. ined.)]
MEQYGLVKVIVVALLIPNLPYSHVRGFSPIAKRKASCCSSAATKSPTLLDVVGPTLPPQQRQQPPPLQIQNENNSKHNVFDVDDNDGRYSPMFAEMDQQQLNEHQSRRSFLIGAMVITGAFATSSSSPSRAMEASTPQCSSASDDFPTSSSSSSSSSDFLSPSASKSTSIFVSSNAASATAAAAPSEVVDWETILKKASKRALGGGKAGASAAVVQVCSLMWLRTSMNYQYRYGGTLGSSLQSLWQQGGLPRLYQGLPFALIQGPLTRFGDTAANVGILVLLDNLEATRDWPIPLKTAMGSVAAGLWRIFLMPIDASKTAMQVEGREGLQQLWSSVASQGPSPLYRGALAQAAATAVGHFPWFATYNFFDAQLPVVVVAESAASGASLVIEDPNLLLLASLARSAFLGLSASCVSDCTSNSLRVIKTTKQTAQLGPQGSTMDGNTKEMSYPQVIAMIIEQDGIKGLFGRGLQTRLLTNAIQGAAFSVLWKYFQQSGGVA